MAGRNDLLLEASANTSVCIVTTIAVPSNGSDPLRYALYMTY